MPGENIQDWSTSATLNGNADSAINWAEGQPRASVNNSARSMMAAHAKDRNLRNGSIVTGGTANAQTFFSGLDYTTIPTGLQVRLKIGPNLTNTGPATLKMDNIGAVAIKNQLGVDIKSGDLITAGYGEFLYDGTNWILLFSIPAVTTQPGTTTITTIIADGSGVIEITENIDDKFDAYMLVMTNVVPVDNNTELWIQVSEDAGATWKTTLGDYKFAYFQTHELASGGAIGASSTFAIAMTTGMSNLATPALSGIVHFFLPSLSSVFKMFQFDHTYISSANLLARTMGSGVYKGSTNPINGVRILPSTGVFATGNFTMFGVRSV